jgi:hypothetical protein
MAAREVPARTMDPLQGSDIEKTAQSNDGKFSAEQLDEVQEQGREREPAPSGNGRYRPPDMLRYETWPRPLGPGDYWGASPIILRSARDERSRRCFLPVSRGSGLVADIQGSADLEASAPGLRRLPLPGHQPAKVQVTTPAASTQSTITMTVPAELTGLRPPEARC